MKRARIHSWTSVYYILPLFFVFVLLGEASLEAKHPFQRFKRRFCRHFCHDCYTHHQTNRTVIAGENLQTAIDEAEDGDVIRIGPGVFEGPFFIINKNLTLIGSGAGFDQDAPDVTTLTGNGVSRVLEIKEKSKPVHVKIQDLTIKEGAAHHGAGILSKCHTLRLDRVDFIDNQARGEDPETVRGGAIFSHNHELHIHHSNIVGNVAAISYGDGGKGGGIADKSHKVVIKSSVIRDNFADAGGGGIFWEGYGAGNMDVPDIEIDNTTISSNAGISDIDNGGGGMNFSATGSTTLLIHNNCNITGNMAFSEFHSKGGGIFLKGPLVGTIRHSIVSDNQARGGTLNLGGGIFVGHGVTLHLIGTQVIDNIAEPPGQGGGVFVAIQGTLHHHDSTIEGNTPDDIFRE